jgi:hypothetical protein
MAFMMNVMRGGLKPVARSQAWLLILLCTAKAFSAVQFSLELAQTLVQYFDLLQMIAAPFKQTFGNQ